jgi:lipoprotein signal peptidase
MNRLTRILVKPSVHAILFALGIVLDQATKLWAVAALGNFKAFDGFLYSREPMKVIGDWFWFTLAYNKGAAFSITPQKLLPFLSPNLFFTIVALGAFTGLAVLYRNRPAGHLATRLGVVLVVSGGIGNLIDRWRIGRVVDFISWGLPDVAWRWPTFNIADSLVCVGVGLLVLADYLDVNVFKLRTRSSEPTSV